MTTATVYAATQPGGRFEKPHVALPDLGPEEVEIAVDFCGICHSDRSMLDNQWGIRSIAKRIAALPSGPRAIVIERRCEFQR